jgi:hypothetical protein
MSSLIQLTRKTSYIEFILPASFSLYSCCMSMTEDCVNVVLLSYFSTTPHVIMNYDNIQIKAYIGLYKFPFEPSQREPC